MPRRLLAIVSPAAWVIAGIVALGQMVGAQSGVPRPNVTFRLNTSLAHTPLPGDFDKDGRADVVAGNAAGNLVLRRGNGDGTFAAEQLIATGYLPLAVADFDADGNLDVLATRNDGLYVFGGNGDGTFDAPVLGNASAPYDRAVVADFDGNGTLDVAAVADDALELDVFSGNGHFAFAGPISLPSDYYPEGLVAADFNNDGKVDLALATRDVRKVDLFMNRGSLSFAASGVTLDRQPVGIAAADVDGDGVRDLIVAAGTEELGGIRRFVDGAIYVLHSNGDGTFAQRGVYPTNNGPISIALGDFNRDGRLDVATTNSSEIYDNRCDGRSWAPDNLSILPGLAGGGFGAAATFTPVPQAQAIDSSWPDVFLSRSLRTADFNGDGQLDLIAPGALILNSAPATNRPPVADAGPDRSDEPSPDFGLRAVASDPDGDWLTFEWRDDSGRLLGTLPHICVFGEWSGRHTFTLTVRDGRGGVATDSVVIEFPSNLPAGFESADVGSVAAPGDATFDGSTFTIRGSGADIWGTSDEFHFVAQFMTGDFDISARVASVENVNAWTKAGIMVREGMGASARHASLFVTPSTAKGLVFQRRPTTNGSSVSTTGPAVTAPVWVRLTRRGDTVTAYWRRNATDTWTWIGAHTIGFLSPTLSVGLAVSSHVDGTLATAQFTDYAVTPVNALPNGWFSRDIGAVGAAGSTTYDNGVFRMRGSGADIWGTADEFQYAYRQITDSQENYIELTARVTAVENVNAWTKAGLMLRTSTAADAAHVSIYVTPGKGIAFQRRHANGGTTVNTSGPLLGTNVWLRLLLSQEGVRAYYRPDTNAPWTLLGSDTLAYASDTYLAGLAVSSHDDGRLADGIFDHVTVRRLASWSTLDIGSVGVAGSGTVDGTTAVLRGSGADIWGSADAFRFLYSDAAWTGLSAHVVSVDNVAPWTKAGVMVRDNTTPGSPQVMLVVTPGKGVAMQYRAAQGGTSATLPTVAATAPKWLRLTRSGNTFIGEMSNDGMTWQEVGRVTVTMQQYALGGLVVSSHDNARLATAVFDDVVLGTVQGGLALFW